MLTKRIIPCLDVKDGRVVKGINFLELRDAGDPVEQASAYDAQAAKLAGMFRENFRRYADQVADSIMFRSRTTSHFRWDMPRRCIRPWAEPTAGFWPSRK